MCGQMPDGPPLRCAKQISRMQRRSPRLVPLSSGLAPTKGRKEGDGGQGRLRRDYRWNIQLRAWPSGRRTGIRF